MDRERVVRCEGIVLHLQDLGECDRIVRFLTPEGRLDAVAKGVRRVTSRKAGHLELFTRVRVMLARGHNLDIITQAEALESHAVLGTDLSRFAYACYVGELAMAFAQDGDEAGALYDLTVETLACLATGGDLPLWTRSYEVRLLDIVGYRPELYHCPLCEREIRPVENAWSPAAGGVICQDCAMQEVSARAVSVNTQKVLRYLQSRPAQEVTRLKLGAGTRSEVEALLLDYLEYVLERELRSAGFVRRLRHELRLTPPDAS